MTGEITITVTTTLTAADVFRIIIGFSRVWFTCINSAVHCEFPIPSESLHLRDENGVPTIHTEADLEKDPSVSISCDAYHLLDRLVLDINSIVEHRCRKKNPLQELSVSDTITQIIHSPALVVD